MMTLERNVQIREHLEHIRKEFDNQFSIDEIEEMIQVSIFALPPVETINELVERKNDGHLEPGDRIIANRVIPSKLVSKGDYGTIADMKNIDSDDYYFIKLGVSGTTIGPSASCCWDFDEVTYRWMRVMRYLRLFEMYSLMDTFSVNGVFHLSSLFLLTVGKNNTFTHCTKPIVVDFIEQLYKELCNYLIVGDEQMLIPLNPECPRIKKMKYYGYNIVMEEIEFNNRPKTVAIIETSRGKIAL